MSEVPNGWKMVAVSDGDIRVYGPDKETWLIRKDCGEGFYDFIHRFFEAMLATPAAPQAEPLSKQYLRELVHKQMEGVHTALAPQAESPQEPLTDEDIKRISEENGAQHNVCNSYWPHRFAVAIQRTLATRWGVTLKGDT